VSKHEKREAENEEKKVHGRANYLRAEAGRKRNAGEGTLPDSRFPLELGKI